MLIKYSELRKVFYTTSSYGERHLPKAAGLFWNGRLWITSDVARIEAVLSYCTPEAVAAFHAARAVRDADIAASMAVDCDIEIPIAEGFSYRGYQKAGIAFARDRPATLIGDQPGLGKTIQAIGLLNLDPRLKKVLIVCPLAVKTNWGRELRRFLSSPRSIEEVDSSKAYLTASIVIVHFNQLSRLRARLRSVPWDVVIVDEAHTLRNQTAMTKALFGEKGDGAIRGRQKTIHLTGTPAVNYPIELFPLINHLDPVTYPWSAYKKFKQDFGDPLAQGYRDRVIAFQERLRKTLMIRRLKKDVLAELPSKIRQVIEIPAELSAEMQELNAKAIKVFEARKDFLASARVKHSGAIEESTFDIPAETVRYDITLLSQVRHMNAVAKIPHAIAYVEEALLSGSKIVVFAHHQDVLKALHDHFGIQSVIYVGGMSVKAKDASVAAFQTKNSVRLFLGSIYAAGTGITLTAGSHCIFVELDWVPGTMEQAEDRQHRLTQRDSVLVQHLVFPGSLDMRMAEVLLLKQEGLDALTNYENLDEVSEVDLMHQAADTTAIEAAAAKIAALPKKPIQPMALHHSPEVLIAYAEALEELLAEGTLNHDTSFVRNLVAQKHKWSEAQAACVERLLCKYRGRLSSEQLQRAGMVPAEVAS
jgi:SWI/SNF-related matrix-associated actin-dependent regulator 1 of chromatin subfamily A